MLSDLSKTKAASKESLFALPLAYLLLMTPLLPIPFLWPLLLPVFFTSSPPLPSPDAALFAPSEAPSASTRVELKSGDAKNLEGALAAAAVEDDAGGEDSKIGDVNNGKADVIAAEVLLTGAAVVAVEEEEEEVVVVTIEVVLVLDETEEGLGAKSLGVRGT